MTKSLVNLWRTRRFWREESGQDLVEYALLGALIAVFCVVSMQGLTTAIAAEFGVITAGM